MPTPFCHFLSLFTTLPNSNLHQISLSLDNYLSATVLRFGISKDSEIPFTCHLDSCAAMNIANLLLHMWIITTYPAIAESYAKFDDALPFHPIG